MALKGGSNSLSKQLQQEETWKLLLLLSSCLSHGTGHSSLGYSLLHQKMKKTQAEGPPHKHFFIEIRKSNRYRLVQKKKNLSK